MDLDWVLFDADGVLQTVRDGWLEALTAAGGAGGQDFVLAVFETERACVTGQDFAAAMAKVLTRFRIERPLAEVLDAQYWIVQDHDMLAAVAALQQRGFRCGLATNQQNLRGAYMRTQLGLDDLFDAAFYSYELGLAKPDPDYFRTAVHRVGADPGRVLFLDDHEPNALGAREAGLHAETFPSGGGVAALRPILARYGIELAPGN